MKERVFFGKGIRRVLSLMFCLAVCLILIPMTASAAEGDAKVITEINLLCPETVYENEKDFQATISETSGVASNLEGAIWINDSYWEETATGKMATEVVAGHKYRLVFQLSTRYECLFQEKSANPGEFGGVVKHNGKMIAADTKLDNSTGRLAIYTKEITAQPDYFTKQPVGGIGKVGKPFTITFGTLTNTEEISLMREEDNGWWTEDVLAPGTTSCDIPFCSTSEPVRFRLRVFTAGGNLLLSDAFEVTWVNDYFTKQPVGGISEPGKPYTVTFEHFLTDGSVVLATGIDYDHLIYLSMLEDGKTSLDIPIEYGKPGTRQYYVLVILDGGGPGVNVYSEPVEINWSDYFKTQPVGGVSEPDKPYTITFANCVSESSFTLKKFNKLTGSWDGIAILGFEDVVTYDIPYGTPGETDRYYIDEDYLIDFGNGRTMHQTLSSNEFEVTWRKEGVLPKISKENLVTVPENLSVGSRLAVNEKVIETNDDMMMGYLSGYVTWVYTSAAGKVSTYRFNHDYEYFTVAKDMDHGSVHCEVYNENEDIVWVSPEISFETLVFLPEIITQPANITAEAGEKVTFSVTATGEGLTYQWQYRNAGATTWSNSGAAAAKTASMTFTVGTDKTLNGRQYRCIVKDKNGKTVTSNAATLTVTAALAITSQPVNQTAAVGASVSFKVAATGEGLTYQWQYKNASATTWSNSGAAAAKTASMTFTVGTDKTLNGRQYRCIVKDKNGKTVTSNAATLTVSTAAAGLAITSQPANQTAAVGEKVTFSVKVSGEGLTYQWQYRSASASTWTSSGVAAAKTANMSFTVTDKNLNGRQYRCIVKDKNGKTVTSNAATLTVGAGSLAITGQPANQTAAVGEKVTFSITATGEGLTYQWQYRSASASTWTSSGVAAAKTANMSFTVTDKNLNGRQYRCIVTDKNGATVTSNAVTLTVGAGLAITSQPANQTAAVGEKVTFSVKVSGEGLTYQWQYRSASASTWTSSGVAAAKTANMSFTVTDKNLNGRQYRCIVKDKNGKTVTSNAATLTVK